MQNPKAKLSFDLSQSRSVSSAPPTTAAMCVPRTNHTLVARSAGQVSTQVRRGCRTFSSADRSLARTSLTSTSRSLLLLLSCTFWFWSRLSSSSNDLQLPSAVPNLWLNSLTCSKTPGLAHTYAFQELMTLIEGSLRFSSLSSSNHADDAIARELESLHASMTFYLHPVTYGSRIQIPNVIMCRHGNRH